MRKHFLLLTEDGTDDAGTGDPGVNPPASSPKSAKYELKTNISKTAIEIVHKQGNLTNIPNQILLQINNFNDDYSRSTNIKKYFTNVELKDPDKSNAADRFNKLETEVIKAEQYTSKIKKDSTDLVSLIGNDIAEWVDNSDHEKGVKFKDSNYQDENKKKEAQEKFNKKKAQAEQFLSTRKNFSFATTSKGSGVTAYTPIKILNKSLGVIRNLMKDLNNLVKLSIFSTNFHKNYNNNLKFFESTLKMSNALHNKTKIEQQIKDAALGATRVSRINTSGTANDKVTTIL